MKKCFYVMFVICLAGFINIHPMEEVDSSEESSSKGQKPEFIKIKLEQYKNLQWQREVLLNSLGKVTADYNKLKKDTSDNSQSKNNDSVIYHINALIRKENFWWLIGSLSVVIYAFYKHWTFVDEEDSLDKN